jgi:uncharacterized hydrophobic protein (TIGR00341 family)
MKLVEVVADSSDLETLANFVSEQFGGLDSWYAETEEHQRQSIRFLVDDVRRQAVLDSLQDLLANTDNARIIVMPIEAVWPRQDQPAEKQNTEKNKQAKTFSSGATREELYLQIEKGARLDGNYLILVILSTVVAAIGLLENNVAVVVGAMVIAPLLGPNLALSFAATLGDRVLMRKSLITNVVGLGLALFLSFVIGWLWPVVHPNAEILSRTDVGFSGVLLAMASGAAAVLSLTTGLASALVGVMVAVALLPPTATLGMMLASGQQALAAGAALLLAVNVVCVNLSANLVFIYRGLRPRTWLEKRQAQQSLVWSGLFWTAALCSLLLMVYLRHWVRN